MPQRPLPRCLALEGLLFPPVRRLASTRRLATARRHGPVPIEPMACALEFHRRRTLRAGLRLEVGFFIEACTEPSGHDDRGERISRGIECLRSFVVAHALDRDPVFGPL